MLIDEKEALLRDEVLKLSVNLEGERSVKVFGRAW